MLSAKLQLKAEKSQAYFDSLCKHFGRKVEVVREESNATVVFPIGVCHMSVNGQDMFFTVQAEEEQALEKAKFIIESHALMYGELKNTQAVWTMG